MTGFGSAEGSVRDGRVRVDIRAVNHRFFNPQLKLPPDLQGVEAELRERMRELMGRGHVAVSVRWTEPRRAEAALTVDVERARAVVAALKELKKRLRLKGEPDLGFVARHPDVLRAREGDEASIAWSEVQPVVETAAREALAMREREGAALARDLHARLDALAGLAAQVAERAPARLVAERERLRKAVADLTAGDGAGAGGAGRLDEQRLALEVALLADRVDVNEELVRFGAHLAACRAALAGPGAMGKQLGFLAQELLRETNTIGSKANDAAITHAVIGMKGELERFREQLENLE